MRRHVTSIAIAAALTASAALAVGTPDKGNRVPPSTDKSIQVGPRPYHLVAS